MASDLELSLFEQELVEVRELPEASRWLLERDGSVSLGLLVTMYPSGSPEEFYLARIRWTNLFEPASLKFLRLDTGADDDIERVGKFFEEAGHSPLALEGHEPARQPDRTGQGGSAGSPSARRTGPKERRWRAQAPSLRSAARCSGTG